MIELNHLFRFYGETRAVDDVSFQVGPGEVFGYIGPNGAGKTTSMRVLATLDLPTGGDAYVDGFSVVDDPDRVRQRLGYMPDSFGTYANVNVREYLDFFARAYGLVGRERTRSMQGVMAFTQLDQLAEKPINGLSKGMKQRLCLGRAMIHDPSVMILDEPAAGLDPRARIELRSMVRQLAEGGKAILVSSHILSELGEMCDRVAIIEQGKLLAVGSVAEIQERTQSQRSVQVRPLGDNEPVINWLEQHQRISDVHRHDGLVVFSHDGDQSFEAEILGELIRSGFAIAEYANQAHSLEDVFLHVTEGRIQ